MFGRAQVAKLPSCITRNSNILIKTAAQPAPGAYARSQHVTHIERTLIAKCGHRLLLLCTGHVTVPRKEPPFTSPRARPPTVKQQLILAAKSVRAALHNNFKPSN